MHGALDIAVMGLSLRSTNNNGHAATWRTLVRALQRRGHHVRFFERNHECHAQNQDLPADLAACVTLYDNVEDLREAHGSDIAAADVVMLGSRVSEGVRVADWLLWAARGVVAFYDLDTPVTLAKLRDGDCDYVRANQIAGFHMYLSATGGPALQQLRRRYGACAKPLYCAVDAQRFAPSETSTEFDLGYLGTRRTDRRSMLRWYLVGVAAAWPQGRFVMAGAEYPDNISWPHNIERVEHPQPARQRAFYASQRFTLNLTREEVIEAGWSPSVGLFEAAACGLPVITDAWPGIEAFFAPGKEILLAHEPGQVLDWLRRMPDTTRHVIGEAARRRVLAEHTADHRVETLERHIDRVIPRRKVMPVARERAF